MKINVPGYSTLTGCPETLLQLLEETRIRDGAEGDDYIDRIISAVEQLWGHHLEVFGDNYVSRAKSLLIEMDKHGLIKIEEE